MRTIDRRFVHGVGFSNGCAEFALKNPPPFVPSCLITSWLATGPIAMVCVDALERRDLRGTDVKFWITPLLHEHERNDDRSRERARRACRARDRPRSCRAILLICARCLRMNATATAMPTAARDEVVERELHHLREVRHRRLADVRLPVRVRGERRRRLERLSVGDGRHVRRIQRQEVLQAQSDIRDEHGNRGKKQHPRRISLPVLILVRNRHRAGGR